MSKKVASKKKAAAKKTAARKGTARKKTASKKKAASREGASQENTGGRPTKYTEELADEICVRLAAGESLRSICAAERMPHISTVLLWVVRDREGFSEQYMQAREAAGFSHADRVADLADMAAKEGIDPQAARAAMDGFKWAAERMAARHHSPKMQQEHTSPDGSMTPRPAIDASKLDDHTIEQLMAARNDEGESESH